MNVGMLWFDNDPKAELNVKIERAAAYYHTKYGKSPTLCYVHPSMLPAAQSESDPAADSLRSGDVAIKPTRYVLPNHFWIGLNGNDH